MLPRTLSLLALAALATCAILFASRLSTPRLRPAFESLPSALAGHFTEGSGWFPGEPFVTAQPVRAWGSWTGSDAHTGSLVLGPFRAGDRVTFALSGYPARGIDLFLEHAATGERSRITHPDVGERWRLTEHVVPPSWRGGYVNLIAIDRDQGLGGWVGLTEPIRGGRGDGANALALSLATTTLNAALYATLALAAIALLPSLRRLPAAWLPLVAIAVVATLGYAAFWLWFAHPQLGRVFTFALPAAAALVLWRHRHRLPSLAAPEHRRALRDVAALTATTACLYLAALHLFPSSVDFHHLAANRFRHDLPIDNQLPFLLASTLQAGESPRQPDADWLSSDRPPLQTGWLLLTLPLTDALGLDRAAAAGTAAMLFQLLWIAGAYGLFRSLGLNAPRTTGWIAALSLSGFFLQNTLYAWPKLSAAALALAAVALLFRNRPPQPATFNLPQPATFNLPQLETSTTLQLAASTALAALAWLSHGGVAFSFLALLPWFAWKAWQRFRSRSLDIGHWSLVIRASAAFAVLAVLVLPWLAYQKFYDPPGDRLVKWHLAGQVEKDPRGAAQTLRENYARLTRDEFLAAKRANLATQFGGDWPRLLDFSPAGAVERRNDEFFHLGRAFTWWTAGLLALPLLWLRLSAETRRRALFLVAWTIVTVLLWCLLMFIPGSAIPHQGSYVVPLVGFVLLSLTLELTARFTLALIAVLQSVTFITTWLPGNPIISGTPHPAAIALLALAGTLLALFIARALHHASK